MFWFFGREAHGILAPRPGIEPAPSALEGEVFNHWTAREVPTGSIPVVQEHPFCTGSVLWPRVVLPTQTAVLL